jgi:MFS family permease
MSEVRHTERPVSRTAWVTLALLSLLYILSFVDRFILALMIEPLKRDLGITDVQAGLLFGTWFAIFYGLVGLPLARIADRGYRKRIIVAGAMVWSAATFASAFARDYGTIAVLRMGLAVGEAALVPAALAALSQTFPAQRKVLALTLFSAAGMLGASLYSAIGAGVLAAAEQAAVHFPVAPWRLALAAVGLPGVLIAALVALVMREPAAEMQTAKEDSSGVLPYLAANWRLYVGIFGASAAVQSLGYALVGWSPTLLVRNHGLSIGEVGIWLSTTYVLAIVGGTLLMPGVLARIIRRDPARGAWLPVMATGVGVALILAGVMSPSLALCLVLLGCGLFLMTGTTNSIQVLMQLFVPAPFRATLTAILMFSITCIGLGLGPPLAAWLGEASGRGIGAGLALLALPVGTIGTVGFAWAARRLAAEIERGGQTSE